MTRTTSPVRPGLSSGLNGRLFQPAGQGGNAPESGARTRPDPRCQPQVHQPDAPAADRGGILSKRHGAATTSAGFRGNAYPPT